MISNDITDSTTGVVISSGGMADLFENDIDDVRTGVFIGNSAAADLVDNTITGPEPDGTVFSVGVFVTRTSTGNFSNDVFFGDGDNVIESFDRGIRCRDNSAVRIGSFGNAVPQDDGAGNAVNTDFEGAPGGCATDIFGGAAF